MIFRQLFEKESSTYTYLLGDEASMEGILIDPVDITVDRDLEIIKELGINIIYALNTHCHADHITGTGILKGKLPSLKSVISEASGARADKKLKHGDVLKFGKYEIKAVSTPGHTDGCMTFICGSDGQTFAFTGDALLIRGCGRTDFQGGSSEKLYNSVHSEIFSLPDNTFLYPAHDYKGRTMTTVKEEKIYNPRLSKSLSEFNVIMANLNLAKPVKIDVAVPANLVCGVFD